MHIVQWNTDLIKRYDKSGPRYTSYPTALQFSSQVSTADLQQALKQSNQSKRPLSLYIHIPFCANVCYYCACNKVITKDRSKADLYVDTLIKEMVLIKPFISSEQTIEQLHIGGGTPTFLNHAQLQRLMDAVREHFTLHNDNSGDYSIEIDPREADWATTGLLRKLGFNRLSLGLQDLTPEVQKAVNRLQTLEETQAVIDAARALQFKSINIDLIYGLPLQTPEYFTKSLAQAIELQPDRLSLFNYAHLPERFMPQRRINNADLPSPEVKLQILQQSIDQLADAGYHYIGMDHFALADDELTIAQEECSLHRNFQGYTTHGYCDLIGLGVSSISQIGNLYCQNTSDLNQYQQSINEDILATQRGVICSQDDQIRRTIIQQLMCHFTLDFGTIEKRYNINFKKYFSDIWSNLEIMHNDQLIKLSENDIEILPTGRLLVRSVCMLFDIYLSTENRQRFSKII
ncbi:UNVERIFIED_CONTAM: hypothetical protein GTU68_008585 [Idotea baltica]|nr:hypothetical protein [Idotea baltica]